MAGRLEGRRIAFLCTEEAGYITGAALEVAGGIPLFTA